MKSDEEIPFYRELADNLTKVRLYGSYVLAGYIVKKGPDFRNWKSFSLAGGLMITDYLDGVFARKSKIPSSEGAKKDEENDKIFYQNVLASMAIASGDKRYLTYGAINQLRDIQVSKKRTELRENDLSSQARNLGKRKTQSQDIALLLDLSTIGKHFPDFVHSIHAATVGLSLVSGVDVILNANKQLADKSYNQLNIVSDSIEYN